MPLYENPNAHGYLTRDVSFVHQLEILKEIMTHFSLEPGDRVLEVGAGSGRYTSLMKRVGLNICASEPDDFFANLLQEEFKNDEQVDVIHANLQTLELPDKPIKALCGFHVLHHLNDSAFASLVNLVQRLSETWDDFQGWFFIEPNPWNPLYLLQILITPGMSFAEEKNVWVLDHQPLLSPISNGSCVLGSIGLWPPREVLEHLPTPVKKWKTSLKDGVPPWALYRLFGARGGSPQMTRST